MVVKIFRDQQFCFIHLATICICCQSKISQNLLKWCNAFYKKCFKEKKLYWKHCPWGKAQIHILSRHSAVKLLRKT